ncbi:MAG: hypothetical protein K6F55_11840 [Eubacterium sp.]|nr:hypothetical protein [Eubacterium sp.]
MKKQNIKKIISIISLVAFLSTTIFSSFNAEGYVEAAGKMKKLKSSQYEKMIQGGMTKEETKLLLSYLSYGKRNRSRKQITKSFKEYQDSLLCILFATRLTDDGKFGFKYNIKKVNRLLSSFCGFRFKKNKKYKHAKTDSKHLTFSSSGGGYDSYIVIKSAKYNSKKIEIKYEEHNYLSEHVAGHKFSEGTYKATFKRLKNGKYTLSYIKFLH